MKEGTREFLIFSSSVLAGFLFIVKLICERGLTSNPDFLVVEMFTTFFCGVLLVGICFPKVVILHGILAFAITCQLFRTIHDVYVLIYFVGGVGMLFITALFAQLMKANRLIAMMCASAQALVIIVIPSHARIDQIKDAVITCVLFSLITHFARTEKESEPPQAL
ncbi:MAG: hypothetical protein NUV81_00940 [bacterium]|nr:hypothetical protein [bacterium]